jgi:hypothetical protein
MFSCVWIYRLIINTCKHDYEVYKEIKVQDENYGTYSRYHLKCKKCCNIKKKDIK